MNIGIVTFYSANNYGALLQCYALSQFIKENKYNVYLVKTELPEKNITLRHKFRHKLFDKVSFRYFRDSFLPSFCPDSITFDSVVFGSDQIWNLDITKQFFLQYFGSSIPPNVTRIAYAASFGTDQWKNDNVTRYVRPELEKFKSIYVREESGLSICMNTFSVEAQQVIDPTLLHDKDFYKPLCNPVKNKNYVACYIFNKDENKIKSLKTVSDRLELDMCLLNDARIRRSIISIPFPTVHKWISYLYHSNYVVTDSFHCMVFAIIFEKDFVAIPAIKSRAGRMTSLLTELGLSDRYYSSIQSALESKVLEAPINYKVVNDKLNILRTVSQECLKKSLVEALPSLDEIK